MSSRLTSSSNISTYRLAGTNNKAALIERLFVIQHLNLCYAVTLVLLLFWGDPVTGILFPTTSPADVEYNKLNWDAFILERISAGVAAFSNAVVAGLAWVMAYTGLPVEPAAVLAVLMLVDFIAGITRAISVGEPITSRRWCMGLASKMGVMTIPLVMALTAKGLGADFNWLINWSVSLFILSEAYSIVANIYTTRTGVAIPEWDAVSMLLNRLKNILEGYDKRQ